MPARIVIASYDKFLKNALARNVSGPDRNIKLAFNIVEAASHFSLTEPNILIYDIDDGVSPSKYISLLLNKYSLLIILTGSNPKKAYNYFAFGVKDYIIKPDGLNSPDGEEFFVAIKERVKMFISEVGRHHIKTRMSGANTATRFNPHPGGRPQHFFHNQNQNHHINHHNLNEKYKNDIVIAIASSTGGTEALDQILKVLPPELPPILIVQHITSSFTKQFAKRLDNYSALTIKEAEDYEPVYPGTVYIAPGDFHMTIARRGKELIIQCVTDKKINGVRPSADILFNSVAEVMGNKAIGVILTGMGADGAKGLNIMKSAGSINIGQDEKSCVVYGMPKVAYELGCIDEQLPLSKIPEKLIELSKK